MKLFDNWLYKKVKDMWDNPHKYQTEKTWLEENTKMGLAPSMSIDRSRAEGEGRITFELTTAIGGRILNVRRYDDRRDCHETQTYVIPSGEDVGARVAKIVNIEMIK